VIEKTFVDLPRPQEMGIAFFLRNQKL